MKSTLASAASVIFAFVTLNAHAVQTADCGRNMAQVKSIMRNKLGKTFKNPDATAISFVGTWQGQAATFAITKNQNFNFASAEYTICPQKNGSFYIYQTNDPSQAAFFRLRSGVLQVYSGTGMLAMAQGNYVRPGSQLAGNPYNRGY
jgi:hypothetical protein